MKRHRHGDPRRAGPRAEGLRRRARLLLRELEPAAPSTQLVGRDVRLRAGQPLALGRRRAARPALPDAAAAGQAGARGRGRGVRRGGGPAPLLAHLRPLGRASGSRPRTAACSGCPPGFAHGFLVLSRSAPSSSTRPRLLRARARAHAALERSRRSAIDWPLEGAPVLKPKDAAGAPLAAGGNLPVIRVLVTGAGGQVGRRCSRACSRDAPSWSRTTAPRSTSRRPTTSRARVREARPQLIVNAAAYTAVDRAESRAGRGARGERAWRPAILARGGAPPRRAAGALLHRLRLRRRQGRALRRGRRAGAAERLRAHQARGRARDRGERMRAPDPAHELGVRAAREGTSCSRCCGSRTSARSSAWWTTSAARRPRAAQLARATAALLHRGAPARPSREDVEARGGARGPLPRDRVRGERRGSASRRRSSRRMAPAQGRRVHARRAWCAIATRDYPTPARRPANSLPVGREARADFRGAPGALARGARGSALGIAGR